MKCPSCGNNVKPTDEFCDNCGAVLKASAGSPLISATASSGGAASSVATAAPAKGGSASSATIICSVCGTENKAGEEFCTNCGADLTKQPTTPVNNGKLASAPTAPAGSTPRGSGRVSKQITACPNCATPINAGDRFCRKCGFNFKASGIDTGKVGGTLPAENNAAANAPMQVMEGMLLDERYRVTKRIGAGGMGEVFLVDDTVLPRKAVVKRMLQSDDPADAAAAVNERRFLSQMEHPNIVKIYDVFNIASDSYIVMEFVRGKTLYQMMKESGKPFAPGEAIQYIRDLLPAFAYMHRLELVYCDFKPQNAMVQELNDGSKAIKLIDLGTVIEYKKPLDAIYGTEGFYAPEAVQAPTPQTDLYTICRSLTWMITLMDLDKPKFGMPPLDSYQVFKDNPMLYRLLYKGTHPDPNKRFKSAEELQNQLDGILRMVVGGQPGVPVNSIHFATGQLALTSRMGSKAFSKIDENDKAVDLIRAGDSALKQGNVTEALNNYNQAIGTNPASTDARLRLAEVSLEQNKIPEAVEAIKKAEQIDQTSWKVAWQRGRLFEAQGQFAEALQQYQVLVDDLPGELPPLIALARVQAKLNQLPAAVNTYSLVLRADPTNNDATFGAADALVAMGNFDQAAVALNQVSESSSRYNEAQLRICEIFLYQKKNLDARDLRDVSEAIRQLNLRGMDTPQFLLAQADFYQKVWDMAGENKLPNNFALPDAMPNGAAVTTPNRRKLGELAEQNYREYLKRNPAAPNREEIVRQKFKVAPWRLF